MANLYITEQGAVLRKTGDRLIVQKEEEILLDVPCNKVESVLIFGNVQFTTQAVHELFAHGIEMALLTRTGRLVGQITSPATKNIELRLEQFKRYWDETFRLDLSRIIVTGKITNSLNMMRVFSYNHPGISLTPEMDRMHSSMEAVKGANDINSLMGIEGAASRAYFSGFGKMILSEFTFEGRRKRPATDPVNAPSFHLAIPWYSTRYHPSSTVSDLTLTSAISTAWNTGGPPSPRISLRNFGHLLTVSPSFW